MVFLKGIGVWLVIILAETLHGTARTLWLTPLIGDFPARQVSFFTGVGLILAIATFFVRWLHASHSQVLKIGALWAILTLAFEIGLGRFILGYSWERVLSDYNLSQGGLMAIGLVILTFAPLIAEKLNRTINKAIYR